MIFKWWCSGGLVCSDFYFTFKKFFLFRGGIDGQLTLKKTKQNKKTRTRIVEGYVCVPDCVDYKVGRIESGDAVSGLKKISKRTR